MLLELQDVDKSFGETPVLRGVSLSVAAGETVVLLGPSGSGKTTLLRLIAGLETAERGRLSWHGRDLRLVPPHERGFGFVFQDYALFPHKNVAENVAFGLRMLDWERERIERRVAQVLKLVGLADFGGRAVYDLSGGEQQRVALARSLAPAPRLLLLDEPLGSLDRALRERLMGELQTILKEAGRTMGYDHGITAVYVTHDQAEAFAIADRVVIMKEGRIEQQDSPVQLYRRPATPFVARFLGMENLLPGRVVTVDPLVVATTVGDLHLARWPAEAGAVVSLLIRPEAARTTGGEEATLNQLQGRLHDVSFRGRYQVATVMVTAVDQPDAPTAGTATGTVRLRFEFDVAVTLPPPGSSFSFCLSPEAIVLLDHD